MSRYLQLVPGQDMLETARELHTLRSRYRGSIATLSDEPNGTVEEGLPPGQERAGVIKAGGTTIDVILVRVDDPKYGNIWLVSSETVAQIPQLYAEVQSEEPTLAERIIPGPLNHQHLLGMSLAQWLAWLLSIPISWVLAWVLAVALSVPRRVWAAVLGDQPRGADQRHSCDRHPRCCRVLARPATPVSGVLLSIPSSIIGRLLRVVVERHRGSRIRARGKPQANHG